MRLTQNDIRYIINESSKRILNEISIKDSYLRFYQDIKQTVFNLIVGKLNGGTLNYNNNAVLLPETKWALQIYRKSGDIEKERFLEDIYKLKNSDGTGYLDIFIRLKNRRMISGPDADLNKYKTIGELGRFVNSFDLDTVMDRTKGEMSNAVNSAANDIEIPYEDEVWKVVIPKTYEASCYWGKGSEWCTATRETDKYYRTYSSQGPLYININKTNSAEKYQFHFESKQFMDIDDVEIDTPIFTTIGATEGLINFYSKIRSADDIMNMKYEPLGDGCWLIEKKGKYNIINKEQYPLCDLWFDDMGYFYGGYMKIRIGAAINYINTQGDILSEEWFDTCTNFSRGWAGVGKKIGNRTLWNVLFDDGTIGCDFMWFDNIIGMNHLLGKCEKDGIFLNLYKDKRLVGANKNHIIAINSLEEFYTYRKYIFKEYVRMRKEAEEMMMNRNFQNLEFKEVYTTEYIRRSLGIAPDYHIKQNDLEK